MKLTIDHLIVVTQEVEVADTCPSCKADLTAESALKLWEFQDQSRYMTVRKLADGEYEIDDTDGLPSSGESFRNCSWHCAACDEQLLVHNECMFDLEADSEVLPTNRCRPKPPPGIIDLLKIDEASKT